MHADLVGDWEDTGDETCSDPRCEDGGSVNVVMCSSHGSQEVVLEGDEAGRHLSRLASPHPKKAGGCPNVQPCCKCSSVHDPTT